VSWAKAMQLYVRVLFTVAMLALVAPTSPAQRASTRISGTSHVSRGPNRSGAVRQTTLREAAQIRGMLIGSSVLTGAAGFADPLLEPKYKEVLARQFNMIEPENAMKWMVLHPAPGTYDFKPADEIVRFAKEHGMKVRGHTLCWGVNNPSWLERYRYSTPEAAAGLLHDHIRTVVSHFRGDVFAWDVVNEAYDNNSSRIGHLQDSIWYNQPGVGRIGTGFIEQAFQWAHEADPSALLFYNDNNLLTEGPKFEAVYSMLLDFIKRGVPIDGVGLQVHVKTEGYPEEAQLQRNLVRIADLGLQIHLTEVDVAIPIDSEGRASEEDLRRQAWTYERLLKACVRQSMCTAFQTWGFTDKYSWIPLFLPGLGAALPWDELYRPKPAFAVLRTVLTDKTQSRRMRGTRASSTPCGGCK
jgi:endo-1,4-beta-xylanase